MACMTLQWINMLASEPPWQEQELNRKSVVNESHCWGFFCFVFFFLDIYEIPKLATTKNLGFIVIVDYIS